MCVLRHGLIGPAKVLKWPEAAQVYWLTFWPTQRSLAAGGCFILAVCPVTHVTTQQYVRLSKISKAAQVHRLILWFS